ncbi:MAG: hypothetical protein R6T96_16275, partial [Longimicrobiales bacterium]
MALIPDDPRQRNALIIGILAAAGFYFFWSYWYQPAKTEVDEMAARLEQLDSENRRAQIIATRGGTELEERLAVYERHVGQLEALIPPCPRRLKNTMPGRLCFMLKRSKILWPSSRGRKIRWSRPA